MSGFSVAKQAADAFNRHGKFTARTLDPEHTVEVRYADTGDIAATVWVPSGLTASATDQWMWLAGYPGGGIRYMPKETPLDVLVPAVATHVLDESKR